MRLGHRTAVSAVLSVALFVLLAAGCGWSPPSGNPPESNTCSPADGPTPEAVNAEIAKIGGQWRETARGNTTNCQLFWVQLAAGTAASDAPGQVLFFDRKTPIGTPTPEPRPYVAVVNTGADTVTVQYQWRRGDDPACCPTGIGTVRFRLSDGTLEALDPIPGP